MNTKRGRAAAGPWAQVADAVYAIRPWMNPEVRKGRRGAPWFGVKISATDGRLYRVSSDGFCEFIRTRIGADGDHNANDDMWVPSGRIDDRSVADIVEEIMYLSAQALHDHMTDEQMPDNIRQWSRQEYERMVNDGHFVPTWAAAFAASDEWWSQPVEEGEGQS